LTLGQTCIFYRSCRGHCQRSGHCQVSAPEFFHAIGPPVAGYRARRPGSLPASMWAEGGACSSGAGGVSDVLPLSGIPNTFTHVSWSCVRIYLAAFLLSGHSCTAHTFTLSYSFFTLLCRLFAHKKLHSTPCNEISTEVRVDQTIFGKQGVMY